MIIDSSSLVSSRRHFLKNILPAGTLFCLGCSNLLALNPSEEKLKVASAKHKFLEDSEMSFKELFAYTYHLNLIPLMKSLSNEIGKDKLNPDASFMEDLGMDSLRGLEILAAIENKYDISIDPDRLEDMVTLNKVISVAQEYIETSGDSR